MAMENSGCTGRSDFELQTSLEQKAPGEKQPFRSSVHLAKSHILAFD